ncbi:unnamed protein product [Camellia sinensis]
MRKRLFTNLGRNECREEWACNKGNESMRSYGHSSYGNTNNSTNETNGRARGSTAEEVDPRTRLAEAVVKFLVELGEAVTHVMEIGIGIR